MRFRETCWFVKKELSSCPVIYIGMMILLAFALTAVGMTKETLGRAVDSFYEYVNRTGDYEFVAEFPGLHINNLEKVEDAGFKEIYAKAEQDIFPDLYIEGKAIDVEEYRVMLRYPRDNTSVKVSLGVPFDKAHKDGNGIWISDSVAEEYRLEPGDKIVHEIKEGAGAEYEVMGIFAKGQRDYDLLFSLEKYYENVSAAGSFLEHRIYGVLRNSRDYLDIRNKLKERDVTVISEFDDVFDMLGTAEVLLYVLISVTTLFGVWIFCNSLGILIKRRLTYLIRLRLMGMKTEKVLSVFCLTTAVIVIFGLIVSQLAVLLFSSYVSDLINEFYVLGIDIHPDITDIVVCLIACLIIYLAGVIRLKTLIGRTDLHQALSRSGS